MGVQLLNFPGCVNGYHESGLDYWKCVEKNLNGVLFHFLLYSFECCIYCNK